MNGNDCHQAQNWVPLPEAAEVLGTTPLNVLMHVKRGLLAGVEQESGWLVDPESLANLLKRRQAGAVPSVCASGCAKKTATCGGCA